MKHCKINLRYISVVIAMLTTTSLFAAPIEPPVDKNWYLQDTGFWLLVAISLILMYVIYALAEVVVWGATKKRETEEKNKSIQNLLLLAGFTLLTSQLSAQTPAAAPVVAKSDGIFNSPYLPLFILIFIEVCVITYLALMLYQLTKKEKIVVAAVVSKSWFAKKWEKWNYRVPVEREDEILLDEHDYDGIHELDNSLPPWLNYIFIVTFVFGVIYFIYHFFNISPTQDELYTEQMNQAEKQLAEYRAASADFYDENSVILDKSQPVIDAGKVIFTERCAACHGMAGEGNVGPNLTDDYWIHGGRINDLFKTVKYGVQEKGMASWKEILSPKEIFEVTNYIKSLHGTNPPNGKDPQGDLFDEGGSPNVPADSTNTKVDSLSVAIR